MKNFSTVFLAVMALTVTGCSTPQQTVQREVIPLVPQPVKLIQSQGTFVVSSNTPLCAMEGTRDVVKQFQQSMKTAGLFSISNTDCGSHGIHFGLNTSGESSPEGYRLTVDDSGVSVVAATTHGAFNGAMTLLQLMTAQDAHNNEINLPYVDIEDSPRYAWRGLMIDPARHFLPLADVKTMIEQMGQLKLNRLHLHLTDDQGWRIEIKRYPKLTQVGAWRKPPVLEAREDIAAYGGYYSQDDIKEIVDYAAKHFITVIPEIDMPGHAQAAVAAYPDVIGVTGDTPEVSHDWGINPYLFNTNEKSMTFIKHVLDEVLALFPGEYIHLGGDEAIKDQWESSPEVQAQIRALGIDDAHQMQGWFMSELGSYLAKHGRKMVGWDEILDADIPATATIMSWRGNAGTIKAIRRGHDVVQSSFYLDNLQSFRNDEPAGRMGVLTLSRIYKTDIIPPGLTPEESRHVLGAQGHLWSEFLNSPWYVQRAAFPRAAAIAEILWTPANEISWNSFLNRLPAQMARFEQQGVTAADIPFAVEFGLSEGRLNALESGKATLQLRNQVEFGDIYYSLDGSEPTMASHRYTAPFDIASGTTIRAAVFTSEGYRLAAPRKFDFSTASLLTRKGNELHTCYGGGFGLRMPLTADAIAPSPVYNADIFHNCYVYPKAPLDNIVSVSVDVGLLPRHYGLAHEAHKVKQYEYTSTFGELRVYKDQCDTGEVIATLPLKNPFTSSSKQSLTAALPAQAGLHNLCFVFAAPLSGPFYAVDKITLQ